MISTKRVSTLLLLVIILLQSFVRSQNSVLKFGRTVARAGSILSFSVDAQRGYQAFETAVGSTIIIGTVVYDIQHVVYNDASDPELIEILYYRLVDVDKVDFLFSPLGFGMKAIAAAELRGVPIMNCGVFEIFNRPNPAWQWVTTVLTPLQTLYSSCPSLLYEKGARTMGFALVEGIAPISVILVGGFQLVSPLDVFSPTDGAPVLDKLVKKYKALNPDVFIVAGGAPQMLIMIDQIRRNKFEPKALYFVTGAAPTLFAQNALWQASEVLLTSDFEPTLNYTDSLYGSSLLYQDYLQRTFNSSTSVSDSYYAQAGTVLIESIRAAGTTDRTAVMNKLRSYNGTTIAGPTSFDSVTGYLQRPYFCLQFDKEGTSKHPVKPESLPNFQPIVYPADKVRYAKGYFPKDKKKLISIVVPALGGFILLALVCALVGYLILRHKYHLVFVPKSGNQQEEWT